MEIVCCFNTFYSDYATPFVSCVKIFLVLIAIFFVLIILILMYNNVRRNKKYKEEYEQRKNEYHQFIEKIRQQKLYLMDVKECYPTAYLICKDEKGIIYKIRILKEGFIVKEALELKEDTIFAKPDKFKFDVDNNTLYVLYKD